VPYIRHHYSCCLWDNSIVCSFTSLLYSLYVILPSWLEELAVWNFTAEKMQNLKGVFDTSIKLVLNPPKAKKPKRKQRTCIVLWSCPSAPWFDANDEWWLPSLFTAVNSHLFFALLAWEKICRFHAKSIRLFIYVFEFL
jgi:hypothetical protein